MAYRGGPGYGPGDADGYGSFNQSGNPASSSSTPSNFTLQSGGSSTLPVWALVLIMLASGLVTLTFLWLCVLFICRRRRASQAAVRDDVEVQTTWAAEFDAARRNPFGPKDFDLSNAKRLEADNVELTYVVMAGEDQPSFLARPAANIMSPSPSEESSPPSPSKESSPQSSSPSPSPPTALDDAVEAIAVDPQKNPAPS